MRTDMACKEQPAIHLKHMEERFGGIAVQKREQVRTQQGVPTDHLADMGGPNIHRRQPRLRYAGAGDKFIASLTKEKIENSDKRMCLGRR
jgi:hypothetical protein